MLGEEKSLGDINILIVEDEASLADLYYTYIGNTYNVDMAKTGKEALNKADAETDIVLLDRRLQRTTGDEIAEELTIRPEFSAKIAMLTAVTPGEDIISLPIDDYKMKPISGDQMHTLIKSLLLKRTFEEVSDEFFRLNSKRAALTSSRGDNEEAITEISKQIEHRKQELKEIIGEINNNSIFHSFPY